MGVGDSYMSLPRICTMQDEMPEDLGWHAGNVRVIPKEHRDPVLRNLFIE